jgi:cytochrome c nitrate reductase biogenesis protein NrfE
MIPELGLIALICALAFSILLSIVPLVGVHRRRTLLINYSTPLSYGVCLFVSIAICLLAYCFSQDNFSVMYVAQHSNTQLPFFYKIAALWGGHEGSILFWLFSLSVWTALVAVFHRRVDPLINARVLAIMGIIITGFCLFIIFLSNPFERIFPIPLEGRDLNPMLQDIGLIFHPPLLYLGYVGFAVNFAFALAALLSGKMDASIAHWSRPWAIISWVFLTAGIALGSWWAYYELGWGGWWFWDPVENASLMPWLLGTALLHSLVATEQRGIFSYWTLLLSIFTFSMSLLGTFIVRSGVLTSVHAFALDPSRGIVLLLLLAAAIIGALVIFALRANVVSSEAKFSFLSRETMLFMANILLSIATLTVLLGTFYPMFFTLLGLGSISVGAPYFNSTFSLPVLIALFLMGIGTVVRWKFTPKNYLTLLSVPLLLSIIAGIAVPFMMGAWQPKVAITIALSVWLLLSWIATIKYISLRRFGVFLAHVGVAVMAVGALLSSYYTKEISVRMGPGTQAELAGYQFTYKQTELLIGSNYTTEQATIEVANRSKKIVAVLKPERRHYNVRSMLMSEPGIQWGLFGDLYSVMGEKIGPQDYAVRLYYKPFVRWIWFGSLFMMMGGLFVLYHRYRNTTGNVA